MTESVRIRPARGRLGVLFPGMGAVATTTMAGVMLSRRKLGKPVGSLTQMGRLPSPGEAPGRGQLVADAVPLASLDDIVFGGWDIFPDDAYAVAEHAEVLNDKHLAAVRDELTAIRPMPGVFYPEYVPRLRGVHVKTPSSKADAVEQLRDDLRRFKRENGCDRLVVVWTGSTEVRQTPGAVHASVSTFEAGLQASAPEISNSQMYAWACMLEGVPFANGSPNLAADFPAAYELARERRVALSGKDFKTGQTLMKTALAPMLKTRLLGLRGWYSTNILGNRDGEVLDDPDAFKAKETTKLGVLESILVGEENPDLYQGYHHKVRIDYYPPRGDQKEGWDNIDIYGWLGYPMQIKINFLCRDSILAAPVVLDLALLMDLARRADRVGVQEWLGFYFKGPVTPGGQRPVHDLFAQRDVLFTELRAMAAVAALTAPSAPSARPNTNGSVPVAPSEVPS